MKKLFGITIVFIIWYSLSFMMGENLIPFPHDVIRAFFRLFQDDLSEHTIVSLKRLLLGLIIAIILGTHIGVLIGLSKVGDHLLSPLVNALYPIPKATLLPVFLILFGMDDLSKIILIAFIIIFPIIMNIKNAVKLIPKESFYVARTIGLNDVQVYKEVVIPAIMPSLLTSLRIGIGTSIAVLFISETYATMKGLGYYIYLHSSNNLKMFVGIFTLSLIGAFLFFIVDLLEKRLCKWL